MSRLVEDLVVVNAEGRKGDIPTGWRGDDSQAPYLRGKEPRRNARKNHEGGKATKVGQASSNCKSRDLGVMPLNRKSDGCAAQHAEIVAVVRVLQWEQRCPG